MGLMKTKTTQEIIDLTRTTAEAFHHRLIMLPSDLTEEAIFLTREDRGAENQSWMMIEEALLMVSEEDEDEQEEAEASLPKEAEDGQKEPAETFTGDNTKVRVLTIMNPARNITMIEKTNQVTNE